METTKTLDAVSPEQEAACPMSHGSGSPTQSWLANRRGWVVLGSAAVAGTGLALGEGWVTVAGLAPVLYTLPCAAMMMFCMKGMSRGMQTTQGQTSSPPPPVAAGAAQSLVTEPEKQA